jgi:hypothetical protein
MEEATEAKSQGIFRDTFRAQEATYFEGILLQGTSYIWSVVCVCLR